MWSRVELKDRGKLAFKRNYWKCFIVALVLMLLFSGSGSSSSGGRKVFDNITDGYTDDFGSVGFTDYNSNDYSYEFFDDDYDDDHGDSFEIADIFALGIFGVIGAGIALLGAAVVFVINIFICSPIEIGGCRFFIENASGTPGPGLLFYAFQSGHYGKMVLTLFLKKLYILLWALLLVIPGIVKSYEYRMVSYLLADNPEFSRQDAFRISKEMMDGQKMNAFILDLSFIGWNILSALTFGLVGIFYSNPYENATNAELYLELKQQYLAQNSGYARY